MHPKDTRTHSARRTPPLGLLVGWLILALAPGCAVTTVSLDEPPTVSQSRAKRDLGIDYLSSGRTAMAIRELRASLDLDSRDPETHLWLGEAYRRKGQTDKAESFLLEAVQLAERQDEARTEQNARLNLSALLSQVGRFEEAIEHCEILAEDPTVSTPWRPLTNCGWALMKLGRRIEARERFVQALDYFPRFGPALLNLGILEAEQGNGRAAIKNLEHALEARLRAAGKAEAHYRLGALYFRFGRREKAIEHFLAASESAPNLDWGTHSQAYLNLLR